MNIIKTELRNKTGDEWLNHRMVCYIERDIFTSIEDAKILDYFQGMRTRRVNLPRTSGMYQLLILLNLFNITFLSRVLNMISFKVLEQEALMLMLT